MTSGPAVPGIPDRFAEFPRALATQTRLVRLGGADAPGGADSIPALIAHPDWATPAPVMLWFHGRTVQKELDPGRYLRWIRAGIAAVAVDLPGHGERLEPSLHTPPRSLDLFEQGVREVDVILRSLREGPFAGVLDLSRVGIGGMSAGGMITLMRLCEPHTFACAAVEGATGWLDALYYPEETGVGPPRAAPSTHSRERIVRIDPMNRLGGWASVPLLALHSEADRLVPWAGMKRFLDAVRERYAETGSDAARIRAVTWPETGAPDEHSGFGRFSNDAKNTQTEFLVQYLRQSARPAGTSPEARPAAR
jgi:alpha-beta hydrolase superfamily lysophospholipase